MYRPLTHRTDVSTGSGCPQVNKFEQVSSLGHQMSLAGAGQEGFLYRGAAGTGVGAGLCMVRLNASWVMVTWEPPSNPPPRRE